MSHDEGQAAMAVRSHQWIAWRPTSNGWWPIEAAPQDGTMVDLWVSAGRRVTDCAWIEGAWRSPDGRVEQPDLLRGDVWRATHWRSIPSGPGPAA